MIERRRDMSVGAGMRSMQRKIVDA